MAHSISLDARRIAIVLLVISLGFSVFTLIGDVLKSRYGDNVPGAIRMVTGWFDVHTERSAATWFAAFLLLACAVVIAVIAACKRADGASYRHHWGALAFLFLALSVEEIAALHEQLNIPVGQLVERAGVFYFGWVVVGIIVVGLVVALFFRFWWHLAPLTRRLYLLAAVLYVVGSIGLEMVGAQVHFARSGTSMRYYVVSAFEELVENAGIVIFLYASFLYLADMTPRLEIRLLRSAPPTQS